MIRMAQAASSENPSAPKWGVPPNQRRTGATASNPGGNMDGELCVVPFYGPWEIVFRPSNSNLAEHIATFMEQAVRNGAYIGYGQNNGQHPRTGVFDALVKLKATDPMKIKTLVNCDCSSLVGAAVYFSGVKMNALRTMYTGTQRDIFRTCGEFTELTDKTLLQSAVGIKRGDILLKAGHTAVCLDTDPRQETTPTVIYNCSACNLRSGPGTENGVLKTLHPGDIVQLVSRASNGWGQVRVGSVFGYVSPKYYKTLATAKATGNLWLRKIAGKITTATEIIVIPEGATAYITGETKKVGLQKWYRAFYADREGWASGKYLKV